MFCGMSWNPVVSVLQLGSFFFFFCKVTLAILGPLFFLIHFRISLSISTVKSLRILIENVLNLCIRRIDTLAVLSLWILEYGTSHHFIRSSISAIFYHFGYTVFIIILSLKYLQFWTLLSIIWILKVILICWPHILSS